MNRIAGPKAPIQTHVVKAARSALLFADFKAVDVLVAAQKQLSAHEGR